MAEENVPSGGGSDVEDNKGIAAIGYLGILFLVPLLAKKDSPFAQYHAKQGLVLFIAEIILYAVGFVLTFITFGFGFFIMWIIWLLVIILVILGIVNAVSGKTTPLPVIGKMAENWKI